jgi:hypothetical protein
MPLSDYAHHNEDAVYVWYQEEGRHTLEPDDDDPDADPYGDGWIDDQDES